MTGRNDPCPCGSGKKYKKCCLPKDRAERAENSILTDTRSSSPSYTPSFPIAANIPSSPVDPSPIPEFEDSEEFEDFEDVEPYKIAQIIGADPLMQRVEDLWNRFVDASYDEQFDIMTQALQEEPELCDDELILELDYALFGEAVDRKDFDRYLALLDLIESNAPEAYDSQKSVVVEERLKIALLRGQDDLIRELFAELEQVKRQAAEVYDSWVALLARRGYVDVLTQNRPQVVQRGPSAKRHWIGEAGYQIDEALNFLALLQQALAKPDLTADDPMLTPFWDILSETEGDESPELEAWRSWLAYATGQQKPSWAQADFAIHKKRLEKSPVRTNLPLLLAAFASYAHREENVPVGQIWLFMGEMEHFVMSQVDDKLSFDDGVSPSRKKIVKRGESRRSTKGDNLLWTTKEKIRLFLRIYPRLEYLTRHRTLVFYELAPLWLRFLAEWGLMPEKMVEAETKELESLRGFMGHMAKESAGWDGLLDDDND